MGNDLMVDSVPPLLSDILQASPSTNFADPPGSLLRCWQFSDSKVKTVSLLPIRESDLLVSQTDTYLLLLLRRQGSEVRWLGQEALALQRVVEQFDPVTVGNRFSRIPGQNVSSFLYLWRGRGCSSNVFGQAALKAHQLTQTLKKQPALGEELAIGVIHKNKRQSRTTLVNLCLRCDIEPAQHFKTALISDLLGLPLTPLTIINPLSRPSYTSNFKKVECKFIRPRINFQDHEPQTLRINQNLSPIPSKFSERQQSAAIDPPSSREGLPLSMSLNLNLNLNNLYKKNRREEPSEDEHEQLQSDPIPALNLMPPRLNIKGLGNRETGYTFEDIRDETGEEYNDEITNTDRHEIKMKHFAKDCSEVQPGLFVAGEQVAMNLEQLLQHNITHIVNCAGDFCPNYFEGQFEYLTFFLKDSQNQNIECLFYQVCELINRVNRMGGSVLVHCIQGVSRSVTLVMAYLIFTQQLDYKKAEAFIKSKRGVASPNNGFMVQLMFFYKRLYQPHFQKVKIFAISSHQPETPTLIVARFLLAKLFQPSKGLGLDPRGIFIIQSLNQAILWRGSKCTGPTLAAYEEKVHEVVERLREYEGLQEDLYWVNEGSEGEQFVQTLKGFYVKENKQWNNWYVDVEQTGTKPGTNRKLYRNQDESEEEQVKSKLFLHPNSDDGIGVFDFEDLQESELGVVFRVADKKTSVFIWKRKGCRMDEMLEQIFLKRIMKKHFAEVRLQDMVVSKEHEGDESAQFLDCMK